MVPVVNLSEQAEPCTAQSVVALAVPLTVLSVQFCLCCLSVSVPHTAAQRSLIHIYSSKASLETELIRTHAASITKGKPHRSSDSRIRPRKQISGCCTDQRC